MQPLAVVERFLERLLERPTARLFRSPLQPIQIQRRIERAMENERRVVNGRTRVPDLYRVHMAAADVDALGQRAGQLAADLADEALAFARGHGYALDAAPTVELVVDRQVPAGEVRVAVERADRRDGPAEGNPSLGPSAEGEDLDLANTRSFEVQPQSSPAAVLHEQRPDGRGRRVLVDGGVLTIGRAPDNDLVLEDQRVSRHHARLVGRRGMLVLTDLESANGSRVNGVAISEVALGAGDRIEIGTTILMVEAVSAG
ncbi:MAG: FhaA domain-containing protein [Candidatus Limnocylindrales bacterium]